MFANRKMIIAGKSKRDLIVAIVFGVLFLAGSSAVLAVKWREYWRNTHVTNAEAVAFADRMGTLYATGTREQVRALFFDDAILRNRTPEGVRGIDLNLYMVRFDDTTRPYKHTVKSVEVSGDGTTRLVLDCRVRMFPDRVTEYRKYIILQKRNGRIGIVERERDLTTTRTVANKRRHATV